MNLSLPVFWYGEPWYFLAALIVLLIPGLAFQSWMRGDSEADGPSPDLVSRLADTIALSIAITALVGLWLWVAGIRLSGVAIAVLYGLCLLAILAALLKRDLRLPDRAALFYFLRNSLPAVAVAFLLVTALTAWRFYQARELVLPAWVDSVHHTLLVRVILEQGGLPRDFQPYIPAPAYYHYGFHLAAALHAFWGGVSADRSVLWFGQLLNAAAALAVYRAAYAFHIMQAVEPPGSRIPARLVASLVALISALLAGFAFHMPAYYLSWGRYTLLTGIILLGPAMAAVLDVLRRSRRADGIRLALLIAGMCAVHYFALLLAGLFVAAAGVFSLINALRERNPSVLIRLAGWSVFGLLLAAPWLVWVYQHTQGQVTVDIANLTNQTEAAQQQVKTLIDYLRYLLGPRRNYYLMAFAAVGLLAALRKPHLRSLVLWSVILCVLSLPWGIRFGPFRPDHYVIILFFPAAVLLADLLVQSIDALLRVFRPPEPLGHEAAFALLTLVIAGLLVWGVRETRQITNPATVIATQADVQALDWVNANTSQSARFFINAARWQVIYRGVDGGYWLMPYTGRFSLVPPTFYSWGAPDYVGQITSWAERAQSIEGCTEDFWKIASEAGLTHVYLREGTGALQPAALQNCPNLQLIYQVDGVFIYQIGQ